MRASDLEQDFDRVLFTQEQVEARVAEVAAQIDADYEGRDILMVGVLNGAVMTLADLCRSMRSHMTMDWMAVSSYGAGTKSSGVVRILKDLSGDIEGKDVLIVEDIIDTGLTLSYLVQNLRSRGPKSLEIMAMFRKPEALTSPVDVRYVGFDIPNEFVVGYGLDYAGRYRNLTDVATLAPHVYA
ncbi:hypoxanthine phosphoribosyltransferase [Acidipropionibacterium timonense]|uniref:hypoxanthine phosphoribosyltransferase n=1 Tax=Acidipropionibacterium timonense TaxID=2161818 RepID=UPI001030A37F|nr:hypoxanthine phosphoribosyltransferase [Acidipropionibacterium timonense]